MYTIGVDLKYSFLTTPAFDRSYCRFQILILFSSLGIKLNLAKIFNDEIQDKHFNSLNPSQKVDIKVSSSLNWMDVSEHSRLLGSDDAYDGKGIIYPIEVRSNICLRILGKGSVLARRPI